MKYNHKAIATAVVFQQTLGCVWYSELLFLNPWLKAIGKTAEGVALGKPLQTVASIICAALFCYLLSWVFQILVIDDWLRGLVIGLLIGIGFLVPNLSMHYLSMGYGSGLIWIDGVREIISSGGTGIILAVWTADKLPRTCS